MVTSLVPAASVTALITSAFTVAFTPILVVFPAASTAASAVTFPSPLLVTVTVAFVPAGSFSDGTVISVVVSFLISSEGLVSVVVLPLLDELPLDEFFFKTTVPPSTAAGMVTSTLPLFTVYDVPEYRSFKIVPLLSLTGTSTVCAAPLIFKPTYNLVP